MIAKTFGIAAGHFFQIRGIGEKPRHPMIAIALGVFVGVRIFFWMRGRDDPFLLDEKSCSYSKNKGSEMCFFGWIGEYTTEKNNHL